jgi:hypothetical protein
MRLFDDTNWFERSDEEGDRQTASLGAVAVTLFLIVLGLFIVRELHAKAVLEDCMMSGRTNCMVAITP